jgi:hypothetical protein
MKSEFKGIRIIIAVAISFSILITSAYFCYYTVAAADFLSPNLNLETFDQEFLSAACENELKTFLPASFLNDLHRINYFFEFSYSLSSIIPSLGEDAFILRC